MLTLILYFICLYFLAYYFMKFISHESKYKRARSILDRKLNIEIENIPEGENIEKNIIQVYKKKELIPEYIINNIKDKNEEWQYHFFDDEEMIKYLEDNYGEEFVKKYNSFNRREHKEDLFKLCWLYKNGGVFVDLDIDLILPLNDIIENVKNNFAILLKNYLSNLLIIEKGSLVNSLIVVNKGNLKIKKCIENIMKIDQTDITDDYSLVLFIVQNTLIDGENYQFFEKPDLKEGKMEIYDIKDRKIANSEYSNYKNGKFIL